jgi:uncharacterized protein (DUF4415 family)
MKKPKPLTDEEGEVRELLLDDIKRFRPAADVLSPSLAAKLGVDRRAAPKTRKKGLATVRLSRDVLERFRATGAGWQTRMDQALREWLDSHSPADN